MFAKNTPPLQQSARDRQAAPPARRDAPEQSTLERRSSQRPSVQHVAVLGYN